ncbi:MAG TPA: sulfite oxidase [Polyangiaceae bacterium]|nr:sulfite oxidase [Polyangiaceae bacterium]
MPFLVPEQRGQEPLVVDPEEARRRAVDAGLIVHNDHPLNCETSVTELLGGVFMPSAHFYVRNHFHIPKLDPKSFRLRVTGLVRRTLGLSLRDLDNMPSKTLLVTLECAGNGRALFEPPISGEHWELGAVSTAEWTGVSLPLVLERAGALEPAVEVVFRGADGAGGKRFERSLPLELARDPDVLLAYAMNGERLPREHGYPLRLIVPRWYAMASVKWLTEIELVERPFHGPFQTDKYWYEGESSAAGERRPVALQRVRALIAEPGVYEQVPRGPLAIRGVAWSGGAPIARVDVSLGDEFLEARLIGTPLPHAWQRWELLTRVDHPGRVIVRVRATDRAGNVQPERAEWNAQGYGNNAMHRVPIRVV